MHWLQFQNYLTNKFRKKSKTLILGQKNLPYLTHFGHNKNFPKKISSAIFMDSLKPNFTQKFRKKLRANPEKTALPTDRCTDEPTELNSQDPPGCQ